MAKAKQVVAKAAKAAKKVVAAVATQAAAAAAVAVPPVVVNRVFPIAGLDSVTDILTCTGNTWNARWADVYPVINIADDSFALNRFEYVATPFPGSKWSILHCSDNGQEVGVPFKDSYSVLNNAGFRRVIETLLSGIEKLGLKWSIETSGTLRNRARQFVGIKIDGLAAFTVEGRVIHSFLNALNSIDKSCVITFANNTFTVCCANTFAMALSGKNAPLHAMVKHSKNMGLRLAEVPTIIEAYITGNKELFATLKQWATVPVTLAQAESLFAAWLGDTDKGMTTRTGNVVLRLKELFAKGKGNKGETVFDLFNAVTEYYTHESAGKSDDAAKQFESSETGDAAKAKAEFYDYLRKVLESAESFAGFCKAGDVVLVAYNKAKIDKVAKK